MRIQEESCIGTPGFAGFVPSMKYQFGLTYGNATRHILRTDHSLKKGMIQQELQKRIREHTAQKTDNEKTVSNESHAVVWKGRNKYATGDDRFSFPPVPGYTGYIPRSQEHFGRPFVETTNESLKNFQQMLKSKNVLPPKVSKIIHERRDATYRTEKNPVMEPVKSEPIDDTSPYKLPHNHPQKTFISGYTGYVPRLQNHFGEPYPHSVRNAIEEFTQKPATRKLYEQPQAKAQQVKKIEMTSPIPGFTGFIPGSRTCYSTTFGKTSEVAYDQFNHRDEKGRVPMSGSSIPTKNLAETLPIPGYRGHIPSFSVSSERGYGINSKECIQKFAERQKLEKAAKAASLASV